MNFDSLNIILTIAAFIVGIMLLTGHGDIFLKGGNSDISKKLYDEEKMAKASGVALILIGVVSAIDLFTTALAFKIAYIVALLIIIVGPVCHFITKQKKTLIHKNKKDRTHFTVSRSFLSYSLFFTF